MSDLDLENKQMNGLPLLTKKLDYKIFVYLILLSLIVISIIFLMYLILFKEKSEPIVEVPVVPISISMEEKAKNTTQELGTLMSLSPIVFPKVISGKTSTSTMPDIFKSLILVDAMNLEKQDVVLENNKTGFKLVYNVPRPLADIASLLPLEADRNNKKWTELTKVSSEFAGVTVLENTIYQVEILESYINSSTSHIVVLIVKK